MRTTVRAVYVVVTVRKADSGGQVVEALTGTRTHPFSVDGKGFAPAGGRLDTDSPGGPGRTLRAAVESVRPAGNPGRV